MARINAAERVANMRSSIALSHGAERPDGVAAAAIINDPRYNDTMRIEEALAIPRERIVPDPDQPRKEFDHVKLMQLALSMAERGQLQAIRVQWREAEGLYMIVTGERRWRAAEIAKMTTLKCAVVEDTLDARERLLDQLVENCVRHDLKPIEQARAFQQIMDKRGWTAVQLAEHIHVDDSQVNKALALLALPGEVQDLVEAGELAPSTANEIERIPDPVVQVELARQAVDEHLTRDEVTRRARQKRGGRSTRGRPGRIPRPDSWTINDDGNAITVVGPAALAGEAELDCLFRRIIDRLGHIRTQAGAA